MKLLKLLSTSKLAIIDDEDFNRCSDRQWTERCPGVITLSNYRQYGYITLANYVMKTRGIMYDHIDRNPFNNQKENLRITTYQQNAQNCEKPSRLNPCTSKYKGVSLIRSTNRWKACISYNKKQIFLGNYLTEEEAARTYDKFALKYHGEFAVLNFPKEDYF